MPTLLPPVNRSAGDRASGDKYQLAPSRQRSDQQQIADVGARDDQHKMQGRGAGQPRTRVGQKQTSRRMRWMAISANQRSTELKRDMARLPLCGEQLNDRDDVHRTSALGLHRRYSRDFRCPNMRISLIAVLMLVDRPMHLGTYTEVASQTPDSFHYSSLHGPARERAVKFGRPTRGRIDP